MAISFGVESLPQSQTLNSSGVAVDQQGSGTLYQYLFPGSGGDFTNFFQVNGTGRTFGLLQAVKRFAHSRSAVDASRHCQFRGQPGL